MKHLQKHLSASLIALAALLAAPIQGAWAAPAPSLGMASNFAILSELTTSPGVVTCTDSTINGDVGTASSNPLSVTQTNCTINGAVVTPVSAQVLTDFNSAYDQYAAIACDQVLTTLDGQVLSPGVYCVDAAATSTGSVLTLNGSSTDTWIFKIGTSGTGALTGTNFSVVMANGSAVPCDSVTWWVAQAVTMTDSQFVGTILAGAAITITRGTFDGNALAKAAVTLTGAAVTGCNATGHHSHGKCNQGVGNGPESCDPGNSNQGNPFLSNDELGGTPGAPGKRGNN